MKIGILYPRSNAHPGMMADFMDGIKAALKHAELYDHFQLFSESIGLGGNEKEVYEKAEVILLCGTNFPLSFLPPASTINDQAILVQIVYVEEGFLLASHLKRLGVASESRFEII